jgi:zinc transporter ZupT
MELLAFTAGSFIYITFTVILDDIKNETNNFTSLFSNLFYVIMGITFMIYFVD